jgi:hypothetical protein
MSRHGNYAALGSARDRDSRPSGHRWGQVTVRTSIRIAIVNSKMALARATRPVRRLVRAAAWVLAILGTLALLVLIVWASWRVPQKLYAYVPDPTARAGVEATTRTGIIAVLAGLGALGTLAVSTRTYRLTQQGHLTPNSSGKRAVTYCDTPCAEIVFRGPE